MSNSDLLSQHEIDALLSGVGEGEIDTEPDEPVDTEEASVYDFSSQDRIVRGRLPTLELINERFSRNIRTSLFELLRRSPVISVEGVQIIKYGEYVHTLLMPSSLNIIKVAPLRGSGLIVLNPKLVFSLVDCFFGGDGRFPTKIDGRDFTATEMRIVRKVLEVVFEGLKDAWEPVIDLQFQHVNSEINPQFANVVSPTEIVVVSSFHVDVEAGAGYLQIVLPYSMLDPIREQLDSGLQSELAEKDAQWAEQLHNEIKNAKVQLRSTLTTTTVPLRSVMDLKEGDVLDIEMPDTVIARVDDIPVFKASFGASRGNCALKVVERVHHGRASQLNPV